MIPKKKYDPWWAYLKKSTRYLPLGLPLPGALLFPPFGSSSHLLSAPRLCRYPLPFLFLSFLPCFHLPPQATPTLCPLSCPIWPPHPLNSRGGQKIIYKTNKKQLSSLSGGVYSTIFRLFKFIPTLFPNIDELGQVRNFLFLPINFFLISF